MKKFEKRLDKKKHLAEVRLLLIDNLKSESNFSKFIEITKLFYLEEEYLSGSGFIEQGSALLTLHENDKSIEVDVQKTEKRLFSKNLCHEIVITFPGNKLKEIVGIAAVEAISLFIFPSREKETISSTEFIINDNDCITISFSTDKYDYEDVIAKIETILN